MSDKGLEQLISVADACAIIDAVPVQLVEYKIPWLDAVGQVLAEDVLADRAYPPFNKALMDGFAVQSADALSGKVLNIIGEIAAGSDVNLPISSGNAASIMTGAPIPFGCEVIVPVEETNVTGNTVTINQTFKPGHAIANASQDAPVGEILLKRGTRIGPAQLAVLASVGKTQVKVFKSPTVILLATGNELVAPDKIPLPHQIRESNNAMLATLLKSLGCHVMHQYISTDDPRKLKASIDVALQADIAIISGGMSMGAHDHVPQLLRDLHVDLKITKLKIKPGKPFVFGIKGTRNHHFAFGLPGNPVSGFVCTIRLASRLIKRMQGLSPEPNWITAKLSHDLPSNSDREFYQPAIHENGTVTLLPWKGSADVFTLAKANALLVRPENATANTNGDIVRLIEL